MDPIKVEALTVFLSIDPHTADENVIILPMPNTHGMPAIAADNTRAQQLYPVVKDYCDMIGLSFRVVKFSTRTDIGAQFDTIRTQQ